jgi:hypothetical protein
MDFQQREIGVGEVPRGTIKKCVNEKGGVAFRLEA